MRIVKTILVLLLIGLVGFAIWSSPSAQAQLRLLLGTARLNSTLFAVIFLPMIGVFLVALLVAWSNGRRRARNPREVSTTTTPPQRAVEPIAPKKIDTKKPNLSIISGGRKTDLPIENIEERASDPVFFQPVLQMPKHRVVGYDVYRQVFSDGKETPRFSQTLRGGTQRSRAEFEFLTLERAFEAAVQIPDKNARIYLPIGEALLGDANFWLKVETILKSKQATAKRFCLMVAASALLNAETIERVDTMAGSGFSRGVSFTHADIDVFNAADLTQFDVLAMDYNMLAELADQEPVASGDADYSGKLMCRNIVAEANIVDAMTMGANLMSGAYFAAPRALKSSLAQAS